MSDVVGSRTRVRRSEDSEQMLGFTVYSLYLLSLVFPVAPAVVGVVIAYARRSDSTAVSRSHYAFQIRTFWMAALLVLLSVALLAGAAAAAFLDVVGGVSAWDAWNWATLDAQDYRVTPLTLMLAIASGATLVASGLWLLVAGLFGMARLASNQTIGDSRA